MSNLTTVEPRNLSAAMESVLIQGDLSGLDEQSRSEYYLKVCDSLRLNPLTKPFAYTKLNGQLHLYAKKDAAEQLRNIHKLSVEITSRQQIGDIYIVAARASDASGRHDESTGAVNIGNLKGEALANAFMKAETKAKRRVTLSFCGLGMLDETEVEDRVEREAPSNPLKQPENPADFVPQVPPFQGKKLSECDPQKLTKIVVDLLNAAQDPERAKKMTKEYEDLMIFGDKYLKGIGFTGGKPGIDPEEEFSE